MAARWWRSLELGFWWQWGKLGDGENSGSDGGSIFLWVVGICGGERLSWRCRTGPVGVWWHDSGSCWCWPRFSGTRGRGRCGGDAGGVDGGLGRGKAGCRRRGFWSRRMAAREAAN
ncbi:leucine-rich repeat extensin-like protein 3 [Iris pallida]|uniref:Leucine-rich repeat extensin-like protein 3 n=1 Tax=Iris pallida TaxID=29817 RepID=A0AAX6IKC1_IRIPA|nr:leucine-rich repeat extensin-like protein 3 [Iris pallida]